ncbi:MogA/MoaB family molybdenum cofactor biosynthesis protein [Microbacterium sp. BK668]|uniref:MogA/MoaB family molybdenum cofactor biosynthesis protein n=1 Tax=Microbacterium sp. BK668 TaxID=2512118 RepID=UPI0010617878|nr:MogA/MoaB family molybdenum cofactor biosynthesis protein [Microbacterium sp. BK668]TDN91997.1 molybdenum cofactor synthesis domain-containing protein [Microbacterium sp. BK668]
MSYSAAVITVSDRSAAGARPDAAGPAAVSRLIEGGFACDEPIVVPDGADSVERALWAVLAGGARLVVTMGGTGVGPRDETPEGTARVIGRPVPGIAEELRRLGAAETPGGMISRGLSGVVDPVPGVTEGALIVNLPGSPKAVASGIPVVLSVARHVIDQLAGGDHA